MIWEAWVGALVLSVVGWECVGVSAWAPWVLVLRAGVFVAWARAFQAGLVAWAPGLWRQGSGCGCLMPGRGSSRVLEHWLWTRLGQCSKAWVEAIGVPGLAVVLWRLSCDCWSWVKGLALLGCGCERWLRS